MNSFHKNQHFRSDSHDSGCFVATPDGNKKLPLESITIDSKVCGHVVNNNGKISKYLFETGPWGTWGRLLGIQFDQLSRKTNYQAFK